MIEFTLGGALSAMQGGGKRSLTILAIVIGLLACKKSAEGSPPADIDAPLPTVQGSGYLGVIFPAERGSEILGGPQGIREYWTPTPDQVKEFESRLREALVRAADDPAALNRLARFARTREAYVAGEIRKILEHLGTYRRQYFGVVVDGRRRMFVNFFPGPEEEGQDLFGEWRKFYVLVMNGGFWFWQVQYDMEAREYVEFESNGYA